MGSPMWMDTGQARGHAAKIDSGVASVRHLIDQITELIDGIYWEGADKQRFLSDWNGQLRPQAAHVMQTLADGAGELRRRADEQDRLSQSG